MDFEYMRRLARPARIPCDQSSYRPHELELLLSAVDTYLVCPRCQGVLRCGSKMAEPGVSAICLCWIVQSPCGAYQAFSMLGL